MKKLQNLLNPEFEYQRPQGSMSDLQIRLLQGLPAPHNNINVESHLVNHKNPVQGIFYNPLEKQNPFINNNTQNFLSSVLHQLPNYPERISAPMPTHDLAFGLFGNTNNNNSRASSNSMFLEQGTLLNNSLRNSHLNHSVGGIQPKNLEELFQKSTLLTTPRSTAPSFFSSTPSPYPQMNSCSLSSHQNAPLLSAESLLTLSPAFGQARPMNNHNFPIQSEQAANHELVSQLAEILKRDKQNQVRSLLETLIVPQNNPNIISPNLMGVQNDRNNLRNNIQPQNLVGLIRENPSRPGVNFGLGLDSLLTQPNNLQDKILQNMGRKEREIQQHIAQAAQAEEEKISPLSARIKQENKPEKMPMSISGKTAETSLENIVQLFAPQGSNPNKELAYTLDTLVISEQPKLLEHLGEEDDMQMEYRQRGVYSKEERRQKILKYKNKIAKWRSKHPVKRVFKGRSNVAGQKPRIKGKFVSIEEYTKYSQNQDGK